MSLLSKLISHRQVLVTNVNVMFFIISMLVFSKFAMAQQIQRNSQVLVEINQPISVDGILDEDVWKNATKMMLAYENNPGEGNPAPVKTEVFFYQDGTSLNVAFKAFDSLVDALTELLLEQLDPVEPEDSGLFRVTESDLFRVDTATITRSSLQSTEAASSVPYLAATR